MFSRIAAALTRRRKQLDQRKKEAYLRFRPGVENLEARTVMAVVTIAATDNTATETGQTTGMFTITVDTPSPTGYTVNITPSGTATNYVPPLGSDSLDYLAVSSIAIAPYATTATYTITPYLDNLLEGTESVVFTVTAGTGYSVGSPSSATVNIADDPAIVTFTTHAISMTEGQTDAFNIGLSRSGGDPAAGLAVTLEIAGVAISGTDYWVADTGNIVFYFPGGYSTGTIMLMSQPDDHIVEGIETATYTVVSDGVHYLAGANSPDNVVTLSISDPGHFANDSILPSCLCGCPGVQMGFVEQTGTAIVQADGVNFRYLSAQPKATVTVDSGFSAGAASALSIEARLTFDDGDPVSMFYDPSALTPGNSYRFAVQADAPGTTGRYPWTMDIIEHHAGDVDVTNSVAGYQEIWNRADSQFGAGWSWLLLDQLYIQDDGVELALGDGNLIWFDKNLDDSYTVQKGDPNQSTLVLDEGIYTLTTKSREVTLFNSSGLELSKFDKYGNTLLAFTYMDADDDQIEDEILSAVNMVGRETTFDWEDGVLASVTDFFGRTYSLEYDGANLVSVTAPDQDGEVPAEPGVSSFTYDVGTGLMDSFSRPAGGATTLAYDFAGALASRTSPSETTEYFTAEVSLGMVDPTGGLGEEEDLAPLVAAAGIHGITTSELATDTSYTTDQFGGHLSETDALGNVTHYVRNSQGLATQVTLPDSDGEGGEEPAVLNYTFDEAGNMTLSIGPGASEGHRLFTEYAYDETWNVPTSVMSYDGIDSPAVPLLWTIYTIDEATGDVLEIRRVQGEPDDEINEETDDAVEVYTYTTLPEIEGDPPAGLVASYTDANGVLTEYLYTAHGLVEHITSAVGTADEASVSYEYDEADNLTAEIDELNRRTEHTYDNLGNRISTVLPDPDGPEEGHPLESPVLSWQYNAMGKVILAVDALGRETEYEYGAHGNLLSQTTSGDGFDDITTGSGYDDAGRLTSQYDGLGHTTTFTLDDAGHTLFTTLEDPDGPGEGHPLEAPVFGQTFDALGRVATSTDALSNVTSVSYWDFGRTVITTGADPDGTGEGHPLAAPVTVQNYNLLGQLVSQVDSLGRVTSFEYDMLGNLVTTVLPDSDDDGPLEPAELHRSYDKSGNLVSEEDALGSFTYYIYDSRNRLVEKDLSDPDGPGGGHPLTAPEYHWEFDAASQMISEEDPNGNITQHVFDFLGREVETILPDPDGSGEGHPLESPTWNYTFDAGNRLLTSVAPDGGVTSYEYDLLDNVIQKTLPDPDGSGEEGGPLDSPVLHWTFDSASQLVSEQDALGRVTVHNRDQLGREIETVLEDPDGPGEGHPLASPEWHFSFDSNSNLLSTLDPLNHETVNELDNLGRKVKITDSESGETAYSFDSANNLLSLTDSVGNTTSWFYDGLNRVIEEQNELGDSRYFQHDLGGNLVFKIDRDGRATQYLHDHLGRTTAENWLAGNWLTPDLAVGTTTQGTGTSEVQRVGFTAGTGFTMGTFTLSFGGQTTSAIAYNASAATVQTALQGLSSIGSGNIAVTKTQNTSTAQEWTLTFQGSLSGANQSQVTINSSGVMGFPSVSNIQATDTNGASGTNEVQTVTLAHAGSDGFFTLTFGGHTTDPIVFTADASEVESNLEGLASIGSGNVAVTSSSAGHWTVTFQSALANQNVAQITAAVVAPQLSVNTTTQGGVINEVQRVGMTVSTSFTSGTFTLSFGGYTTGGIAYNASAATVQTALQGLTSIGSGNIAVSKSLNTSTAQEWTLTFQGSLAGANQSQVTINSSGVSGMMSVSNIQATDTNGGAGPNEVQVVTLANATQGTFTLSFSGYTTDPLAYNASASTVQTALRGLASIGGTNVAVSGSNGGPWTVTFQNGLASTNVAQLTGSASSAPEIEVINTISTSFDASNQLLEATDADSDYSFVYDNLGRTLSTTADLNGFSSSIVMANTFDANSNRTQLAATIGAHADFVNDYSFDNLSRTIGIQRHGAGGGNTVAETRIDLAYLADSQFDTITRFTDLAGEDLAVSTAYGYDLMGRLASLQHSQGETALTGYDFTYDAASRIHTIDSVIDGLTTYSYDTTDQLTGADFATQTDETHDWDANGNPDEESAVVGTNNQVLSDGTHNYTYDGEGNRIRRTKISDGTYTEYLWDHRNRLTDVIDKDPGGNPTQAVHYAYDFVDRWIGRTLDDDGAGEDAATSQWFAFDGNQVVLSFDDSEATSPDHRYLNGPAVDQYFADENSENDVLLLLGDHLGTIRDTALVNSGTGDTELKNHTTYSSFNARLNDTDLAFASLIGETGRPHDAATRLDNHLHRWLDGWLNQWLTQDPSGFVARDANLRRFVDNSPTDSTDPLGLNRWLYTDILGHTFIVVEDWNASGTAVVGYLQLHMDIFGHHMFSGKPPVGAPLYYLPKAAYASTAAQDQALISYWELLMSDERYFGRNPTTTMVYASIVMVEYVGHGTCIGESYRFVKYGGEGRPARPVDGNAPESPRPLGAIPPPVVSEMPKGDSSYFPL